MINSNSQVVEESALKLTNKLGRYPHIDVDRAFEKEDELLQRFQDGEIGQALDVGSKAETPTLVLPAGKKWPVTFRSRKQLEAQGWQLSSRKTGGAPVPSYRESLTYLLSLAFRRSV